jgi:hypothetical protein
MPLNTQDIKTLRDDLCELASQLEKQTFPKSGGGDEYAFSPRRRLRC